METESNLEDLKEINGTFLTNDNVQVCTIYFENVLEEKGSYDELHRYFSKFGTIFKLQIKKRYKNFADEIRISGIVEYEKPESAYDALTHVHTNNFVVLPADSWIQPSYLNNQHLQVTHENENYCSLLNLNEDCLIHIFSMLNLGDLIILTSVFASLKRNLTRYYQCKKKVQLNYKDINCLTLMEVREFLIDNGKVIESIEILDWHYNIKSIRYLNFVINFCKELKSLHISSISFKNKEFSRNISQEFPKLKILKLIDCRLDDQDIKFLSNLNNVLRVLDLSGSNNSFTGTYLKDFKYLKEFHLADCEDLLSNNFDQINFSNLEILNITGCNLSDSSFRAIKDFAKNLKILKISLDKLHAHKNHFENFITEINSLEEIIITNCSRSGCTGFYIEIPDIENRIKKLSESKLLQKNLKILQLTNFVLKENCFQHISKFINLKELQLGFSHDIDIPLAFWMAIQSLEKLQTLGIKIDAFKSLDTKFIFKLIEYLIKKENKTTFTLKVEITKEIYQNILKSSVYHQAKNVIKIVPYYFEEPYSHYALSENPYHVE